MQSCAVCLSYLLPVQCAVSLRSSWHMGLKSAVGLEAAVSYWFWLSALLCAPSPPLCCLLLAPGSAVCRPQGPAFVPSHPLCCWPEPVLSPAIRLVSQESGAWGPNEQVSCCQPRVKFLSDQPQRFQTEGGEAPNKAPPFMGWDKLQESCWDERQRDWSQERESQSPHAILLSFFFFHQSLVSCSLPHEESSCFSSKMRESHETEFYPYYQKAFYHEPSTQVKKERGREKK